MKKRAEGWKFIFDFGNSKLEELELLDQLWILNNKEFHESRKGIYAVLESWGGSELSPGER